MKELMLGVCIIFAAFIHAIPAYQDRLEYDQFVSECKRISAIAKREPYKQVMVCRRMYYGD